MGWFHLSTVLDDSSRFIIAWKPDGSKNLVDREHF
jgi:hypothetical protein